MNLQKSKEKPLNPALARFAADAAAIPVAMCIAFLLRFNLELPGTERTHLVWGIVIALIAKLPCFWHSGMRRTIWRHAGLHDLISLLRANTAGSVLFGVVTYLVIGASFPRSVYLIDLPICFLLTAGSRMATRYYYDVIATELASNAHQIHVLVYGAGMAARTLLREIRQNRDLNYKVEAILDDDPGKHGLSLEGVPVVGGGDLLRNWKERELAVRWPAQELLVAIPSASRERIRQIIALAQSAGFRCAVVPDLSELICGRDLARQIREVSLEDLLGREPVQLSEELLLTLLSGKSLLVTGAGGSIGSELCRQIAKYRPSCLVAYERAESDLFHIDLQLRNRYPDLPLISIIGDILDGERFREVLETYRVATVFHAAAYKHVPLMELHPLEAIRNNVVGTRTIVDEAILAGVERFVMISSDKAVRPTNVMGATKRLAELVVSSRNGSCTKLCSVRFGNVLGSNGSVVPLFKAQIERGGPVTVTHPEMTRYFMTIPEATQLVLQAGALSSGGETFVLDMGEPVKIVDLARNLIQLSGLRPDEDIKIEFTGIRPGEKLYEELLLDDEHVSTTVHSKIRLLRGTPASRPAIDQALEEIEDALRARDLNASMGVIQRLVPEYLPTSLRADAVASAASNVR